MPADYRFRLARAFAVTVARLAAPRVPAALPGFFTLAGNGDALIAASADAPTLPGLRRGVADRLAVFATFTRTGGVTSGAAGASSSMPNTSASSPAAIVFLPPAACSTGAA